MGMMNQLDQILGGGESAAGNAGDFSDDEDTFEVAMQKELSEAEQERWSSLIQRDELEQEEMRMIQFSDAYRSLDNID